MSARVICMLQEHLSPLQVFAECTWLITERLCRRLSQNWSGATTWYWPTGRSCKSVKAGLLLGSSRTFCQTGNVRVEW